MKYLIIIVTILFPSHFSAQNGVASLKSTKGAELALEGLVIEVVDKGVFMTDSGNRFPTLDDLEKFIKETKDTFSPVLVLDSNGDPENLAIGLKAVIVFQRSSAKFSLIVE